MSSQTSPAAHRPAPTTLEGLLDLRRANTPRTFFLLALGATIGLTLAGIGLFTAKGTSTFIVPAEDVALVNQHPINRTDYDAAIRSLFGVNPSAATPAQRRQVLDDMIREELFVQRGLELDMPSVDPDVRSALVSAVEAQVAADALTKQPTDAELRAYYIQHQDKYASFGVMTVRDLVAAGKRATDPQLLQAAQALRQGVSPDAVAARFVLKDSGKVSGEEYYFAARIHLGDGLFDIARALRNGGASDPIAQPDGAHILAMIRNVAPQPIAFEQAREQVLDDYRRAASARLEKGDEVFLRKRANILIAKDLQ